MAAVAMTSQPMMPATRPACQKLPLTTLVFWTLLSQPPSTKRARTKTSSVPSLSSSRTVLGTTNSRRYSRRRQESLDALAGSGEAAVEQVLLFAVVTQDDVMHPATTVVHEVGDEPHRVRLLHREHP